MNVKLIGKYLVAVIFAVVFVAVQPAYVAAGGNPRTISGAVTEDGRIVADDGEAYIPSGSKATEVLSNVNKRIRIKGTVKEDSGKLIIDVHSYKMQKWTQVSKYLYFRLD